MAFIVFLNVVHECVWLVASVWCSGRYSGTSVSFLEPVTTPTAWLKSSFLGLSVWSLVAAWVPSLPLWFYHQPSELSWQNCLLSCWRGILVIGPGIWLDKTGCKGIVHEQGWTETAPGRTHCSTGRGGGLSKLWGSCPARPTRDRVGIGGGGEGFRGVGAFYCSSTSSPGPQIQVINSGRLVTWGSHQEGLQIWAGGLPVCLGRHLPGTVGSVPHQEHHLRHPLLPVRCVAPFGHRPVNILQVGQGAKRNSSAWSEQPLEEGYCVSRICFPSGGRGLPLGRIMPISSGSLKTLRVVNSRGKDVDLPRFGRECASYSLQAQPGRTDFGPTITSFGCRDFGRRSRSSGGRYGRAQCDGQGPGPWNRGGRRPGSGVGGIRHQSPDFAREKGAQNQKALPGVCRRSQGNAKYDCLGPKGGGLDSSGVNEERGL